MHGSLFHRLAANQDAGSSSRGSHIFSAKSVSSDLKEVQTQCVDKTGP